MGTFFSKVMFVKIQQLSWHVFSETENREREREREKERERKREREREREKYRSENEKKEVIFPSSSFLLVFLSSNIPKTISSIHSPFKDSVLRYYVLE
jgi:hypothetical protein